MSLSKASSCELERRGDDKSLGKVSCGLEKAVVLLHTVLKSESALLPVSRPTFRVKAVSSLDIFSLVISSVLLLLCGLSFRFYVCSWTYDMPSFEPSFI